MNTRIWSVGFIFVVDVEGGSVEKLIGTELFEIIGGLIGADRGQSSECGRWSSSESGASALCARVWTVRDRVLVCRERLLCARVLIVASRSGQNVLQLLITYYINHLIAICRVRM